MTSREYASPPSLDHRVWLALSLPFSLLPPRDLPFVCPNLRSLPTRVFLVQQLLIV